MSNDHQVWTHQFWQIHILQLLYCQLHFHFSLKYFEDCLCHSIEEKIQLEDFRLIYSRDEKQWSNVEHHSAWKCKSEIPVIHHHIHNCHPFLQNILQCLYFDEKSKNKKFFWKDILDWFLYFWNNFRNYCLNMKVKFDHFILWIFCLVYSWCL